MFFKFFGDSGMPAGPPSKSFYCSSFSHPRIWGNIAPIGPQSIVEICHPAILVGVSRGSTAATGHWIVKGILGRHFSRVKQSVTD
jgi:hypothetical protein